MLNPSMRSLSMPDLTLLIDSMPWPTVQLYEVLLQSNCLVLLKWAKVHGREAKLSTVGSYRCA